ncbi:MAG: hypothetical protein E7249_20880 [Paenibacillaceae bacterium]|nr:hypothetical protein [Paenibacillaceae bacterium]
MRDREQRIQEYENKIKEEYENIKFCNEYKEKNNYLENEEIFRKHIEASKSTISVYQEEIDYLNKDS